jgi:DNA-binding Lrp family transcriptional regulator
MKNNSGTIKLDQLDIKILDKLQTDARITNQDLADAVGLSPSPCLQRVKRLEKAGIIASYRVQIDLNAICRHVDVIAAVTLKSHGLEEFADFERSVAGMQHVVECTKVSGNIDYFVRFICPDIGAYQMLSDELLKLGPKIGNLSSHVVLKTVRPFIGVVLDDLVLAS